MDQNCDFYQDLDLRNEFSNISMVTPDYRYLLQVFGNQNEIVFYNLDRR